MVKNMLRAKIAKRLLPAPIEAFLVNVCEKQKSHNTSFYPPLIVPLAGGNGRSTITNEAAKLFYETKAIRFSSHTQRCLEFKPKGTVDSIYKMDMELQEKATYTNEFQGVVSVAAEPLLPHINDAVGEKFFDLTERIKKKAVLIVFVPVDTNQKQIDLITHRLGIGTKTFAEITYGDESLSRLFYNVSSEYAKHASVRYEDCKERIDAYIKTTIREKTLKNVKKAAEALLYDDETLIEIYSVSNKTKKERVV